MPTAKETTTAKKTTRKSTPKKVVAQAVTETPVETIVEVEEHIEEQAPVFAKPVNVSRTYAKDDTIPCRSVNAGYMCFSGPRSHQAYPFGDMGDVNYLEFQDLNSMLAVRDKILFEPFIVVEDEELLQDVRWAEVKALYDKIYNYQTARDILNLSNDQFKNEFPKLPLGLKNAVKSEVVRLIDNGGFDSIGKIRVIDEVCGTSIGALMIAD